MTRVDLRAFRALGKKMAGLSGYRARQSSGLYPTDGDMIDWMYGRQRIFSFTFELFPRTGTPKQRSYPPDEVIARETRRNRNAILYLMNQAWCPYASVGADSRRLNCGPLFDDLETARGWKVNPSGTDTATDGRWSRGDPAKSNRQLGSAASGMRVLVTGKKAGHDLDGGRTTIRSPRFRVPDDGKATLRLRYWMGHSASAGNKDGLRVYLVDGGGTRLATLASISGDGEKRTPRWKSLRKRLPGGHAGKQLRLELVAVDGGRDSVLEVGVDEVRITAE